MNYIAEHQAVTLIHHLPLLLVLGLIISIIFSNKIKITLRDVFMLIGMSVLSLISYKQFPLFFICTMCIINKLCFMIMTKRKNNKKREENILEKKKKVNVISKIKKIPSKMLTLKGMIYILLLIIIFMLLGYRDIVAKDYVDKRAYPVEAAQWIKENLDIEKIKLFNDFNYGSYLLFEGIPVFIDGRADVYDPKFNGKEDDSFLAYMLASSGQIWYEDVIYNYDISHIITYANSNFNIVLEQNEKNKMIYNDGIFVIYEVQKEEEEQD